MKLRVVDNVYSELNSEQKFKKTLRYIARKKPVINLYVVTEPLFKAGIMEIYNYNELLQPYYRKQKRDLRVFGIASSRDKAKELVCNMLDDIIEKEKKIDIDSFFGIGG